ARHISWLQHITIFGTDVAKTTPMAEIRPKTGDAMRGALCKPMTNGRAR
ncbi:MAG: hypothetical protein GT596_11745, partial [Bacteroidales bacterium]|nr:hypothetical protein [Bacteroidales bacterium]